MSCNSRERKTSYCVIISPYVKVPIHPKIIAYAFVEAFQTEKRCLSNGRLLFYPPYSNPLASLTYNQQHLLWTMSISFLSSFIDINQVFFLEKSSWRKTDVLTDTRLTDYGSIRRRTYDGLSTHDAWLQSFGPGALKSKQCTGSLLSKHVHNQQIDRHKLTNVKNIEGLV